MKSIILFFLLTVSKLEDPSLGDGRVLNESIKLLFQDSIHDETKDLREFLAEINDEHEKNSETIRINSSMNSDNSQTTGNEDSIDDIHLLLPTYDIPIVDKEISL